MASDKNPCELFSFALDYLPSIAIVTPLMNIEYEIFYDCLPDDLYKCAYRQSSFHCRPDI